MIYEKEAIEIAKSFREIIDVVEMKAFMSQKRLIETGYQFG